MIFPYSSDLNASSASTRMSSNSPSSISSDSTVDSVPFDLFPSNDIQTQAQGAWPVNDPNAYLAYLSQLALQQPVEEVMVVPTSPSTPIVQMHNMSLSSSPTSPWSAYAPCGQVTYAPTSAIVAPRPVPSSSPLIGSGWSTTFQSPPIVNHSSPSQSPPARPAMQFKLPPQKGRKSFPCPERDCHMTFPKNNALVQHLRSHTGEKPEICSWCNRGFSLKCNLRRHFRTCKHKRRVEEEARRNSDYSPPSPSPSPTPTVVPSLGAGQSQFVSGWNGGLATIVEHHDFPATFAYAPNHTLVQVHY